MLLYKQLCFFFLWISTNITPRFHSVHTIKLQIVKACALFWRFHLFIQSDNICAYYLPFGVFAEYLAFKARAHIILSFCSFLSFNRELCIFQWLYLFGYLYLRIYNIFLFVFCLLWLAMFIDICMLLTTWNYVNSTNRYTYTQLIADLLIKMWVVCAKNFIYSLLLICYLHNFIICS